MGKGGDKNVAGDAKDPCWVLVDGKMYDIAELKHPGGSIINFYANKGIDATQAFNQFHIRSKKALKLLNSLPNHDADSKEIKAARPLGQNQNTLLEDFDALTKALRKEGMFNPAPLHVVYRLVEIIVMHAVGFWLLFNGFVTSGIICLGLVSGKLLK